MPSLVLEIHERVGEKPKSKEARYCPNCDLRMKVNDASNARHWRYECEPCGAEFWHDVNPHPRPGAKR
jgi:transposase-like protein